MSKGSDKYYINLCNYAVSDNGNLEIGKCSWLDRVLNSKIKKGSLVFKFSEWDTRQLILLTQCIFSKNCILSVMVIGECDDKRCNLIAKGKDILTHATGL